MRFAHSSFCYPCVVVVVIVLAGLLSLDFLAFSVMQGVVVDGLRHFPSFPAFILVVTVPILELILESILVASMVSLYPFCTVLVREVSLSESWYHDLLYLDKCRSMSSNLTETNHL